MPYTASCKDARCSHADNFAVHTHTHTDTKHTTHIYMYVQRCHRRRRRLRRNILVASCDRLCRHSSSTRCVCRTVQLFTVYAPSLVSPQLHRFYVPLGAAFHNLCGERPTGVRRAWLTRIIVVSPHAGYVKRYPNGRASPFFH